jgi:hypothetical protein
MPSVTSYNVKFYGSIGTVCVPAKLLFQHAAAGDVCQQVGLFKQQDPYNAIIQLVIVVALWNLGPAVD